MSAGLDAQEHDFKKLLREREACGESFYMKDTLGKGFISMNKALSVKIQSIQVWTLPYKKAQQENTFCSRI